MVFRKSFKVNHWSIYIYSIGIQLCKFNIVLKAKNFPGLSLVAVKKNVRTDLFLSEHIRSMDGRICSNHAAQSCLPSHQWRGGRGLNQLGGGGGGA
jgi:hypothetical protein